MPATADGHPPTPNLESVHPIAAEPRSIISHAGGYGRLQAGSVIQSVGSTLPATNAFFTRDRLALAGPAPRPQGPARSCLHSPRSRVHEASLARDFRRP